MYLFFFSRGPFWRVPSFSKERCLFVESSPFSQHSFGHQCAFALIRGDSIGYDLSVGNSSEHISRSA